MSNKDEEIAPERRRDYHRLAGKIAHEVHEEIKPMVKTGAKILDIVQKAESLIYNKGARIGFPTNISLNNYAAHYTSPWEDPTVIPDNSVVKVDIGVHIEGFIADTARTYIIGNNQTGLKLKEAAIAGFNAGIEQIAPGERLAKVGESCEEAINQFGFLPIRELSGHLLERYELHSKKRMPNIKLSHDKSGAEGLIELDEAYAFETFASSGIGSVHDIQNRRYIYSLFVKDDGAPIRVPLRSRNTRAVRSHILREFRGLPFAERWVLEKFGASKGRFAMVQLYRAGAVHAYHVLADTKESLVAQHEHTLIITEEGCEITTLPPWNFEGDEEDLKALVDN
ncbi:MAG: type II methionyl aminopeptidase [Candidatus Heimdallarchaeota archaeon]